MNPPPSSGEPTSTPPSREVSKTLAAVAERRFTSASADTIKSAAAVTSPKFALPRDSTRISAPSKLPVTIFTGDGVCPPAVLTSLISIFELAVTLPSVMSPDPSTFTTSERDMRSPASMVPSVDVKSASNCAVTLPILKDCARKTVRPAADTILPAVSALPAVNVTVSCALTSPAVIA